MRTIKLNDGKDYPVLFDFNVTEAVQERYDDITLVTEKMKRLKEIKWLLTVLINEGIAKQNYDKNQSNPSVTEFQIGLLLPLKGIKEGTIVGTIMDTFNDCMGDEKNVIAEDLTTLASSTQKPVNATEQ